MNDSTRPRKLSFVLVVGVLEFGVSAAVLTSLLDWWRTGRVGTPGDLIASFSAFVVAAALFEFWMWNTSSGGRFQTLFAGGTATGEAPTRTKRVLQTIFFIGIMIGLFFLVWAMASQHR